MGALKKEALIALAVFFGLGSAAIVPFLVLYGDRMPRADDGSTLSARQAMGEDPIVFVVVVATALLAGLVTGQVHRRMRPRLVRRETARDLADAARAAAVVAATPGANPTAVWQSASAYLVGLRRRPWPYEPGRVWVNLHRGEVEVIAERSFQKATGLLWHWGARRNVLRMDVRGRARARSDGTATSLFADVYEPQVS